MPLRDLLLTLLVVFVWGTSFVAIKVGVTEMPPILLTGLRFLFSALPAIFFLPRPNVPWRTLAGYGVALGVIKFNLLFLSIHLGVPIGLASVVAQMQVFFTIFLCFIVFREKPTRYQLIGAAVAFCGIAIFGYARAQSAPLIPFFLVLGAAFFWGVANTIGKTAGKVDMLAFVVWASLFAPLPLFVLSAIFEGVGTDLAALLQISLAGIASVAYLALVATVFGFGAWSSLLSRHPVAKVAPFALLIPIVGVACGIVFFGEELTLSLVIGTGIVFAGLIINVFGDRLFAARAMR